MFRHLVLPSLFALLLALAGSPAWAAAVNLNTATAAELETLPGIGPSKASAILAYRQSHGGFKSVDELDAVDGIGPATLASLRDLVSVGDGKAASPPATTPPAPTASTPSSATSAPAASGCSVNINTADASGLRGLPGIGDTKASAILEYRTANGPFASCDGLDAVTGIGPATIAGLRDCCVVK